jgi:hypothetical protein
MRGDFDTAQICQIGIIEQPGEGDFSGALLGDVIRAEHLRHGGSA